MVLFSIYQHGSSTRKDFCLTQADLAKRQQAKKNVHQQFTQVGPEMSGASGSLMSCSLPQQKRVEMTLHIEKISLKEKQFVHGSF